MPTVDRKRRLFENIVRLRRAQGEAPESRDLAVVRAELEAELGDAVSRRLAASILGVSHTALLRWIDRGDVPVIDQADGRSQVPVSALLELRDAVEHERSKGQRTQHLLEPAMRTQHERADRLQVSELLDTVPTGGHRRAERRSLAYHRALARRLTKPIVQEARQTLWRWESQDVIDARYAQKWERLLRLPLPELRRAITEDSPAAHDLRQNSPFAGVLSEAERRRILNEVQ